MPETQKLPRIQRSRKISHNEEKTQLTNLGITQMTELQNKDTEI
jgi:hypothetical protein